MSFMRIRAMKLTKDIDSIKIAYEKGGILYIRTGKDGFEHGDKAPTTVEGMGKWGFRKVLGDPKFLNADDIINNLDKFQLQNDGTIKYFG